jgi:hypothetical protein
MTNARTTNKARVKSGYWSPCCVGHLETDAVGGMLLLLTLDVIALIDVDSAEKT